MGTITYFKQQNPESRGSGRRARPRRKALRSGSEEKLYRHRVYHRSKGRFVSSTIYGGIRYVHPQDVVLQPLPVVVEKDLTTTGGVL